MTGHIAGMGGHAGLEYAIQAPESQNPGEKERRKKAFDDHLNKSNEDQKQKVDEWLRATNSMMRGFHKSNGFNNRPAKEDFISYLLGV